MISAESLHPDWINSKREEFHADPIIIEKVVRALLLLETLKVFKLDFIFKGGTSLMLMIQEPRRFSIDIDIIIEDKEQAIETVLDKVVSATDFIKWEEQKRKAKSTIEKRHFKLFYTPITEQDGDSNNILLDIVFEENPYVATQETDVSHFLLLEDGDTIKVTTPTLGAILGDKLTAYGPATTGVPLTKPKEVLKQIYDVASILDRIPTLDGVRENFINVAKGELAYKGLDPNNFQLIIEDIISCSYNFCCYGRVDMDTFKVMQTGVTQLTSFIYGEKFREPQAQISVAKASYIAKQIERNQTSIERFDKAVDMTSWKIADHNYSALNKLKKHNLEAFHYWYKIMEV
ncbi:MAG: nucleotidyl transferase AbiEii/AbiGii toxin family protein [Bacteroidetes bacterium]|nr:nucleotidyl transferase AbiEii/AbiGii toxin family protein [Bacteroidota bacterium]